MPAVDVVDEASAAAEGTRKTARWIASAFGSVPSLAILSAVVQGPGDAGFDTLKLALGIGLAASGAVIAVLSFAQVVAPIPLEDRDLHDLDLSRIPGQPYTTFQDLDRDMGDLRSAAVEEEYRAVHALRESTRAKAQAEEAALTANVAEQLATGDHGDPDLERQARNARQFADVARQTAAAKELTAAADAVVRVTWEEQLARRDAIRARAYRLKAADEVGKRYRLALVAAVVAAGLIAAGIVLIALAPELHPAAVHGVHATSAWQHPAGGR